MPLKKHDARYLAQLKACRTLSRRKQLIADGGRKLQKILREIALNLVKGNVKLTPKQLAKLKKHKRDVRLLATKRTTLKRRQRIAQKGGFLGALLAPLLTGIATSVLSRSF
jgi:hypothetical protein